MLCSSIYKLDAKKLNGSATVKILATVKTAPPDAFKMIGFEFVVRSELIPEDKKTFWAYVGTTAFVPILDKGLTDVLDAGVDNSNVKEETLKKTSKIEIVRVKRTVREVEVAPKS